MQQAPSPLHVKDISSFVPALLSSHSQMHLIKCRIATFAIPPYGHLSSGHSEPPSSSSPSAHRSEQLWRKSFYAASNPASGSPESSSSQTGILSRASTAFLDQILPCCNWRISFRMLRHLSRLAALWGRQMFWSGKNTTQYYLLRTLRRHSFWIHHCQFHERLGLPFWQVVTFSALLMFS